MQIKTFIVDSFTNEPFKGNPAGVCLLEKNMEATLMQSIATELNLSETAFLSQVADNHYTIRYFTPTVEVDFCGHATLAAAKVLLGTVAQKTVYFITYKALHLEATKERESIKILFPLYQATPYNVPQQLYEAFGIDSKLPTRFCAKFDMLLVEVPDKQSLLDIQPNYQKALESSDSIKELVITCKSQDADYDFYSRCFCPWIGINEDPVTGAAHTVLANYWSPILDKKEMTAFQVSKRGGFLKLKIVSDTELEVRSNARIVFEGVMKV